MRLSEKTLELNLCSQIAAAQAQRIIWFGLTQTQEARAGFDACTRINGRILILQFKSSNQFVRGARRFRIPHEQLVKLRWRSRRRLRRAIYFVLPNLGTTEEFTENSDLLPQTYLFAPISLRRVFRPTTLTGARRASGEHHLDLNPPEAVLRSKPVPLKTLNLTQEILSLFSQAPYIRRAFENVEEFMAIRALLPRKSIGVIVPGEPISTSNGQ